MQNTSAETENTAAEFSIQYLLYVFILLKACSILDGELNFNEKIYPLYCLK
jgi:hypothetical protein